VTEARRYRFGPLERRGLLAGWRGGQIASVASSLALAVFVLHLRADALGAAAALGAVALGVFVGCWPVSGRTVEEWLPTVVGWVRAGVAGQRVELSPVPARGFVAPRGRIAWPAHDVDAGGRAGRGGVFAGLSIRSVVPPSPRGEVGTPMGVVHDDRHRTVTAGLSVRGQSFTLLGPDEKDGRVSGWASALASLARDRPAVARIGWLAHSLPDDGLGVRRFLDERAVLPPRHAAHRSYRGVLSSAGSSASRHEVLVTVQVRIDRRRPRRRARGARTEPIGDAVAVLRRELDALGRQLADSDLSVGAPLTAAELGRVIFRSGQASPVGGAPPEPTAAGDDRDATVPSWPWPVAIEAGWDRLRTDETWHAVYWIAEWPRIDVGADFMGPLLLSPGRRTVAVVMEPLGPADAQRQVERARTADAADSELRRRGGFLATARRSREQDLVVRREVELADGHASFRFSGYVTVTAPSAPTLDDACAATEQAAGQSRLELRRLFGDQARAFACTLPLCRGLS
jgi:hypothetical protein